MATLPENRTTANSPAEHAADHNELHRLHNLLDGHLADPTDAHDASAISFVPGGSVASTNVQDAIAEVAAESGGGVTDHGALTGLADDDHTQYHNDTRGDARYQKLDGKDAANGYPGLDASGFILPGRLPNDGVTYARMQNASASRLLGRGSASGAGDVEEITLGSGLTMAGTTLSAASAGAPTILRKDVDESVASTTTLHNDVHFILPLAVGEIWVFGVLLFVNGPSAGDLKVAFTVPSGGSVRWTPVGSQSIADAFQLNEILTTGTKSFGTGTGGPHGTYSVYLRGIVVNGATAGNLRCQWAQFVSDATATTVKADSHLIAQKVT